MKSRISGLLMETGVSYNKLRLHRMGYFEQLLNTNDEIPDSIRPLLRMSREHIDRAIRRSLAHYKCVRCIDEDAVEPEDLVIGD